MKGGRPFPYPQRPNQVVSGFQNAILRGDLVRPKVCDNCGDAAPLHGHHDDYRFPHRVTWLCWRCHARRHKQIGYPLWDAYRAWVERQLGIEPKGPKRRLRRPFPPFACDRDDGAVIGTDPDTDYPVGVGV